MDIELKPAVKKLQAEIAEKLGTDADLKILVEWVYKSGMRAGIDLMQEIKID